MSKFIGGITDVAFKQLFLPPVPTSLVTSVGDAQVILAWSAPTVSAQTPIINYNVQYSINSGTTWTTFSRASSATTSATVTGLTNGTAYVFRVAAVNAVGAGPYTAASSSTTPSSAPPISVSVAATGNGSQASPFVLGNNVRICNITAAANGTLYFTSNGPACTDCGDNYLSTFFTIPGRGDFRPNYGSYASTGMTTGQTLTLQRFDNQDIGGYRTSIYFVPS